MPKENLFRKGWVETGFKSPVLTKEEKLKIHKEVIKSIMEGNMTKDEGSPFAICTASVGRENKEKYESCVLEVKQQLGVSKAEGKSYKICIYDASNKKIKEQSITASSDDDAMSKGKQMMNSTEGGDFVEVWASDGSVKTFSKAMSPDEADQVATADMEATGAPADKAVEDSTYDEELIDIANMGPERDEQYNKSIPTTPVGIKALVEFAEGRLREAHKNGEDALAYYLEREITTLKKKLKELEMAETNKSRVKKSNSLFSLERADGLISYKNKEQDIKDLMDDGFERGEAQELVRELWHEKFGHQNERDKSQAEKDMGIANAGGVPNSLLADQDLEGSTHSTIKPENGPESGTREKEDVAGPLPNRMNI